MYDPWSNFNTTLVQNTPPDSNRSPPKTSPIPRPYLCSTPRPSPAISRSRSFPIQLATYCTGRKCSSPKFRVTVEQPTVESHERDRHHQRTTDLPRSSFSSQQVHKLTPSSPHTHHAPHTIHTSCLPRRREFSLSALVAAALEVKGDISDRHTRL